MTGLWLADNEPISEEDRRRRLGRVYAILIEAAERRRAQLAQQDAAATPSGDAKVNIAHSFTRSAITGVSSDGRNNARHA